MTFFDPFELFLPADKELSVLLRGNRLVPVMDEVAFEQLVKVSPLLAFCFALSTSTSTYTVISA